MKLIITVKRKSDTVKGFVMGLIGFIITFLVLLIIRYGFSKSGAYGVLNIFTVAIIIWSLWLVTLIFDFLTWRRASNSRTVIKILLGWVIMFFLQWLIFSLKHGISIKAAANMAMVLAIVTAFMYLGILIIGLIVKPLKSRILIKSLLGTVCWIGGLYFIRLINLVRGRVTIPEIIINGVIAVFLAFASASAENPDDAISFWECLGF